MANWIRVGYCQGNFNSDNCAAGGYTLDYGPFGFCERFDPRFQPWTGGGEHFSFFNQPAAAEANYQMFCSALRPLLEGNADALAQLEAIQDGFAEVMAQAIEAMWAQKLGLKSHDAELVSELLQLMLRSEADTTILFRRLSTIPETISTLKPSFYQPCTEELDRRWSQWLARWRDQLTENGDVSETSAAMKRVNPAITWREWLIVPAYEQAAEGDTRALKELQQVFSTPYDDLSGELEATYGRLRPKDFFDTGGVSHDSCSS